MFRSAVHHAVVPCLVVISLLASTEGRTSSAYPAEAAQFVGQRAINSVPHVCDIVKLVVKDHSGADFESITPEARLIEDLGMDYLDHIEFIMDLEDTFFIEIPDEEAEKIVTVGDACDYVIENLPD